ncbi:hypothetical protein GCL60_13295 [Silvanigrella paludirubra]|uniref:Glycosyltransferase family 9 protein n=1 Tax=Silvanigrella paludirubra TaxID=2499159 RepID=A0A6N6VP59_9BACT|nr:glycosyltransferase family 9 protein [Silvanigrella paludirubra]KAB8036814.1 hypothetical protein GCL60_13295 [Silvanigrella paludirubra]
MKSKNILIFAYTGIGDAVMLIPIILTLKRNFPDSCIFIVTDNKYGSGDVLSSHANCIYNDIPNIKFDFIINPKFGGISLIKLIGLYFKRIYFREKFITHFVFKSKFSNIIFRYILTFLRIKTYDFKFSIHQVINNLSLLTFFNFTENKLILNPAFANNHILKLSNEMKQKFNLPDRFVTIQVGAANNTLTPKRWPIQNWLFLITEISKNFKIILVGDKNEESNDFNKFEGVLNLIGKTNISDLMGILANSSVVIGSDSGITHLSSSLSKNTLVLWGPTAFAVSRQIGVNTQFVSLNLPCSPCTSGSFLKSEKEAYLTCQYNVKCMHELQPKYVYNEFLKIWNKYE